MNDVSEVLKTVMKDHKMTQSDIARLFGISQQAVWNRFNRDCWDINDVIRILESMNCRLVIESGDIRRYMF